MGDACRPSDCEREFVEGGRNPEEWVTGVDVELIVASSEVLDERVAADHD